MNRLVRSAYKRLGIIHLGRRRVRDLKIDTQGFERQVIEGGQKTLQRALRVLMELPIIHEYEGEWSFHEALKFMAQTGFVPAQIQPVGFHGKDIVSAVEFDCLFRPLSQVDGPLSLAQN